MKLILFMLREGCQDGNLQKPLLSPHILNQIQTKAGKVTVRAPCSAKGCVKAVILLDMSYFTNKIIAI